MFEFWKKKTPKELLKQNQRALQKSIRELDREAVKLQQQETKLIASLKKAAKEGKPPAALQIMAKDLVRTRNYIQKFYATRTQLNGISLQIQTFSSNQQMVDAMKGVTKCLKSMNTSVKLPQIQKIMMDFERESEMMDMKQEVMEDAMDDATGEDEEESEAILNQVLDEIGISLNQQLNVPSGKLNAGSDIKEDDLQARLKSLQSQ